MLEQAPLLLKKAVPVLTFQQACAVFLGWRYQIYGMVN